MARVSKFKLKEKILQKLFCLFFEVIAKQKDKSNFDRIIMDLLSPTERIMLAKRIAIIYLRMKEVDQKTICQVLKVSSSTTAKFSIIMERSDGIVPQFKKLIRNEKLRDFLIEMTDEIFFAPGTPGVNWNSSWRRKLERERKKEEGI